MSYEERSVEKLGEILRFGPKQLQNGDISEASILE